MESGYILLWRKILESSIFQDPVTFQIAIYLLLKANWKNNTFVFNGEEITIKRGQLTTGRNQIARDLKLYPSTVRNKLDLLKKLDFLDSKSTNKFSIVTVCKYEDYQIPTNENRTAVGTARGQQEDSKTLNLGQQEDNQNENLGQQTTPTKEEKTGQQEIFNTPETGQQEKKETPKTGHILINKYIKKETKNKHNTLVGKNSDQFVDEIVSFWNQFRPEEIPKIIGLSKKRIKNLKDRISENPELLDWKKAIRRIFASDFCKANIPGHTWKADFGWFIKSPDFFLSALEGKYNSPPYQPKLVGYINGKPVLEDKYDELTKEERSTVNPSYSASLDSSRTEDDRGDDKIVNPE